MKVLNIICVILPVVLAAPGMRSAAPTVVIPSPQATVIGSSASSVDIFSGIPFAQPPVGSLRLRPPQPLTTPMGTVTATGTALACPQLEFSTSPGSPLSILGILLDIPLFQTLEGDSEDCLTLNVFRPSGTTASSKLPVLFWIFGGGFETGSTSQFDASNFILSSVNLDKPIIFVAVSYRLGGFGFLPGKEVLADGISNLGLLDQRLGLKWVADNIAAFGGDPDKVTIWGESAGSISVAEQLILYDGNNTYNGKPLFRAGIMDSGSVLPMEPVDGAIGQGVYDTVVKTAGCSKAKDSLECLRGLSYEDFLNAANSVPASLLSYNAIESTYLPRPDGTILTDSADVLFKSGKYAKVPFIIGDQEDEGTLFALEASNVTTTRDVVTYLSKEIYHDAIIAEIQGLVDTYPDDPAAGSPFRTGDANELYPQYKRLAAILGDLFFTLARRALLSITSHVAPTVPSWSYLATYEYGTPLLGTFHGTDVLQVFDATDFASTSTQAYYLSFIYNLDPNNGTSSAYPNWPQWSHGNQLMNFSASNVGLLTDNFRSASFNYFLEHPHVFRL